MFFIYLFQLYNVLCLIFYLFYELEKSNVNYYKKVSFKEIVDKAFKNFDIEEVVQVKKLKGGLNVLELWHGETMAFKDLAMSVTAQLISYFLEKKNTKMTCVISMCLI